MIATAAPPLPDDWLFGWDTTPGIVAVWADRDGHARVWHRHGDRIHCTLDRFRPWLFATHVDDLGHVGAALVNGDDEPDEHAPLSSRLLGGPPGTLRYLITARDGRALQQALLQGARRRLGPAVASLRDLPDYYMVGAVEQYLMATGRVSFRTLAYGNLHRLQLDLETTSLSLAEGRIFLVAVRDRRGLATILEAPRTEDEAALITITRHHRGIIPRDSAALQTLLNSVLPPLMRQAAAGDEHRPGAGGPDTAIWPRSCTGARPYGPVVTRLLPSHRSAPASSDASARPPRCRCSPSSRRCTVQHCPIAHDAHE